MPGKRVPHVPGAGPIRPSVARLRGGLLRGRGTPHARLLPLWSRLLREDGGILESDPAAARHSRLPRRLPVLHPAAERRVRLRQTHLPKPSGLKITQALSLKP